MGELNRVPAFSIQCDWNEVLAKNAGEAWVTCKFRGEPGFHGKLISRGVDERENPQVTASDDFVVDPTSQRALGVSYSPTGHKCVFIAPIKEYTGIHKKSVNSLDVTQSGLCVSACTENKLQVWDQSNGAIRRVLNGHLGEVYKCRFFPSGLVVLSAGADMLIKIWSAETGQCPVTLTGHTAAVMDVCIVDKGRNIISVSRDGSAKLWDCGQSSCLGTLIKVESSINCCCLSLADETLELGEPEETPSEREVGTENKVLIIGCEDGSVYVVAVRSRRTLFSFILPSAVNCVAAISDYEFLVGCHSGEILLYSFKGLGRAPVKSWFESNSPVLCLRLLKREGFLVGRADGSCTYYSVCNKDRGDHPDIRLYLTGPDCDPVYDIASNGTSVYTSCKDGIIRKYHVP